MSLFSSFGMCCSSKKSIEYKSTILDSRHLDIHALFIGDSQVGKSSIVDAMNYKPFDPSYRESYQFDFQKFQIFDNETKSCINFRVWELNVNYQLLKNFKKIQIIYFVFSFEDEESFKYLKKLRNQNITQSSISSLDQTGMSQPIKFLIGNKNDTENKKVDSNKAKSFAAQNNMIYMEISCKNQEDISNLKQIYHTRKQ